MLLLAAFVQGYAERKVLLLCDVVGVCKKLHNEGVRKERLAALKATRTVSSVLLDVLLSLVFPSHQSSPLPAWLYTHYC